MRPSLFALALAAIAVPADWISEMFQPGPAFASSGYGLRVGDQRSGGQRVHVMPDKGPVVVRVAREWPDSWDDALLPNVIWRASSARGESE